VRVLSPFVGGAFGSGLRPQYNVVLAAVAARKLERSVRLVLTRQQMYVLGYRPAMIQQIALGAGASGTLDAIIHDAITVTSQYEDFHRQETGWSGLLYKSAHAKYAHKLARLDLATPCDMRAPSAAPGVYALECAIRVCGRPRSIRSSRLRYSTATSTPTGRTAARACATSPGRGGAGGKGSRAGLMRDGPSWWLGDGDR
jgi:CO/xanthine dehydrogenase Mo-binding subunit